jgi:crotonobetaine/carnitine-CoA ligase
MATGHELSEEQQLAARFQFGGQDIPWLLAHWAQYRGSSPFLIWAPPSGQDRTWDYSQFWTDVRRLAAGLRSRGIVKGDRILIHSDNCPEMVLSWYACATVGAIAVTTNTGSVATELTRSAGHAEVRAAITQPRYARLVAESVRDLDWIVVTRSDSDGETSATSTVGCEDFESLFGDADSFPVRTPEPLLPSGIVFTSGTTSAPKAVLHSHANLLWAGRAGPPSMNFGRDDVIYAQFPFFHTNAQYWCTAIALGVGGGVVLVPKPTITRFWEITAKHGITHTALMPHMQRAIVDEPIPLNQRLKVFTGGGAAGTLRKRVGAVDAIAYGMSETVVQTIRTDTWHTWPDGALGRPAPGYEIKLVNQESGRVCAIDEPGELWVRGVRGIQLFLGYYRNPEANAKAFSDDGWFKTGDIMRQRSDGLLYYQDRDKDRLKVGGENVSAAEVEAVILQVQGVAEAAVVAQKDAKLDVVPVVFVIRAPNAGSEELLRREIFAKCTDSLSKFKRPRAVYFLDNFPRALLNKVAKNRLRELAEELKENQALQATGERDTR